MTFSAGGGRTIGPTPPPWLRACPQKHLLSGVRVRVEIWVRVSVMKGSLVGRCSRGFLSGKLLSVRGGGFYSRFVFFSGKLPLNMVYIRHSTPGLCPWTPCGVSVHRTSSQSCPPSNSFSVWTPRQEFPRLHPCTADTHGS